MINIFGNASDHWLDSGYENNRSFLHVNSCGMQKFITRDYRVDRPHGRADHQLIIFLNGKGYFEFSDGRQTAGTGSLVYFQPGQPQQYAFRASDQTALYWIHFTGYGVAEVLGPVLPNRPVIGFSSLTARYRELFDGIIHELQMKRQSYQPCASAMLQLLLVEAGRNRVLMENKPEGRQDGDLDKVLHMMHLNHRNPLHEKLLAQACNLSLYRFIHKFKEYTGVTPVEYLSQIRVNTACDLLAGTRMPVREVADLVGYDNPLYFSRVFKRITGSAPSHYRVKFHSRP